MTVDRATGRLTVVGEELNRAVAKDMEITAAEQRGGDTLNLERPSGRTIDNTPERVAVKKNNPVRTVVRIDGNIDGVPVIQKLTLYRRLKPIDVENAEDRAGSRRSSSSFLTNRLACRSAMACRSDPLTAAIFCPIPDRTVATRSRARSGNNGRQIQDWIFA